MKHSESVFGAFPWIMRTSVLNNESKTRGYMEVVELWKGGQLEEVGMCTRRYFAHYSPELMNAGNMDETSEIKSPNKSFLF